MSNSSNKNNIEAREADLNQRILEGRLLEAFDEHYAEDVVMQEGLAEPTVGKAANREREIEFLASIAEFHGATLVAGAVNGNRSYSEWVFDATYKDGSRIANNQVAVRTWRDGKIVSERFYSAAS